MSMLHTLFAILSAGVLPAFSGTFTCASGPGASFLSLIIGSGGSVDRETDGATGNGDLGSWITPESASADETYKVRFSVDSGDTPSDGAPLNTWRELSTDDFVGFSGAFDKSADILVEISIDESTILASQIYTLNFNAP